MGGFAKNCQETSNANNVFGYVNISKVYSLVLIGETCLRWEFVSEILLNTLTM